MTSVVISGSGLYTPEQAISNEELVASYNRYAERFNQQHQEDIEAQRVAPLAYSSTAFIEKASGIRSRYVMHKEGILDIDIMKPQFHKKLGDDPPEMVAMAVVAAKEALQQAGRRADEVDLVICAASNFQRPYPALAIELQSMLGIDGFGYDMNVACSSATFAIINATNAIKAGTAKVALVVNPEFASPQLNFKSRDSHFIFGDACTATVIEAEAGCKPDHAFRILGSKQKTVFSNNIRCEVSYADHCVGELDQTTPYFVQQGRKVFKELLPIVSDVIEAHLEQMQLPKEQLKMLWLHQANLNMNQFVVKNLLGKGLFDQQLAPLVLDEYANTASAGSVVAFHKYKHQLHSGEKGLLCSFGAGYSVGSIGLEKL